MLLAGRREKPTPLPGFFLLLVLPDLSGYLYCFVRISFGVDLGDVCCGVAQNHLGRF